MAVWHIVVKLEKQSRWGISFSKACRDVQVVTVCKDSDTWLGVHVPAFFLPYRFGSVTILVVL